MWSPSTINKPPFPPRPRSWGRGGAEPSLGLPIRAIVALLGAKQAIPPQVRRRLELSGLPWGEIAPILAPVRTVDAWVARFHAAAQASEANGDGKRAASQAFLGQLLLSPFDSRKADLQMVLRRTHFQDRQSRATFSCVRVTLAGGSITGYYEVPREIGQHKPLVLLLPPLASTKEELAILADPLLDAGFPVLRLDLPGQGESPPPLIIEAEQLLSRALDELNISHEQGVIAGGISLGAYFALRLAGADKRVRGTFGISPPAIITPEQWGRLPEVIYQYLDIYFASPTREQTYERGLAMTLDDVVAHISCPVRLYHARRDKISLPDARERYQAALSHAPLTDFVVDDTHGCLLHLKDRIAPEVADWCKEVARAAQEPALSLANNDGGAT